MNPVKEIIISPLSTSRNKSVKVPDNQLLESNHSKYLLIDFKNENETGRVQPTVFSIAPSRRHRPRPSRPVDPSNSFI